MYCLFERDSPSEQGGAGMCNSSCQDENADMHMEDVECKNVQRSRRESLIPENYRIAMNTMRTCTEEYMRKYLLLRHMKRGDLAGLLAFLLSPAFEAREGELAIITILDLLPAHRQNFIRQFFLNLKFDFPHQLLLRLIPDLQVELSKQNKRKAISQECSNNSQRPSKRYKNEGDIMFSQGQSQRPFLTQAPLSQNQYLTQYPNDDKISQSELDKIKEMVRMVLTNEATLENLNADSTWKKLLQDKETLIQLAKEFPVQEENVCLKLAQTYGNNPAFSTTALIFVIPSLLQESKHFSRTLLKAVEAFVNNSPNVVIETYLFPATGFHEAKDVGKVYKSILKLLPSPSVIYFLEKLFSKLSHDEWPKEAFQIIASALELKPKLSNEHVSYILNSLLSSTDTTQMQAKPFGAILMHLAKHFKSLCKQRKEEILRILPHMAKLQAKMVDMKLR